MTKFMIKYVLGIIILIMILSCSQPSYFTMLKRDKYYFKTLSESCESLISDIKKSPDKWEQKKDKDSLVWIVDNKSKAIPNILKELNANRILVMKKNKGSNYRVWIRVGNLYGFEGGYSIVWEEAENNLWELLIIGGGRRSIVYAKKYDKI